MLAHNLLLCLIICMSFPSILKSLYVNINYSFKLPKVFGQKDLNDVKCCPYITYPDRYTSVLRNPDFIVLGVPKAGTTELTNTFVRHPRLQLAENKELNWMNGDGIVSANSYYDYLKKWNVIKLYKNPNLLFEVSPDYLFVPVSACRIKHYTPNIKMIVIFRDPTERAYSAFRYFRHICSNRNLNSMPYQNNSFYNTAVTGLKLLENSQCSFNTGFGNVTYNDCYRCLIRYNMPNMECTGTLFYTRYSKDKNDFKTMRYEVDMIAHGLYAAQISWWFHLFNPNQFKLISFSDLTDNTFSTLNGIIDFLGAEFSYNNRTPERLSNYNTNKYKQYEDPKLEDAFDLLRKFYRRPNLEFYKILNDNGHPFEAFEPELQNLDIIDCGNEQTANSGICGDKAKLKDLNPLTPEERLNKYKEIEGIDNNTDINIKEEIINYLSEYNIDVVKDNNSEYLFIQDNGFNITLYSNEKLRENSNLIHWDVKPNEASIIKKGNNVNLELFKTNTNEIEYFSNQRFIKLKQGKVA